MNSVQSTSDRNSIPTMAIEYNAPHKLSGVELVTDLDTEIQPERGVIENGINRANMSATKKSSWSLLR